MATSAFSTRRYLGGGYLAERLGASRAVTAGIGAAVLLAVLAVTLRGARASTAVQLELVSLLVVVVRRSSGPALIGGTCSRQPVAYPPGWRMGRAGP